MRHKYEQELEDLKARMKVTEYMLHGHQNVPTDHQMAHPPPQEVPLHHQTTPLYHRRYIMWFMMMHFMILSVLLFWHHITIPGSMLKQIHHLVRYISCLTIRLYYSLAWLCTNASDWIVGSKMYSPRYHTTLSCYGIYYRRHEYSWNLSWQRQLPNTNWEGVDSKCLTSYTNQWGNVLCWACCWIICRMVVVLDSYGWWSTTKKVCS